MKNSMGNLVGFLSAVAVLFAGCSKPVTLRAAKVAKTSVEASVTTTSAGTVSADQQAVLDFGTVGRISRIHIKTGDHVMRGQELAQLENADLKSILADTEREVKRTEELFAAGLVSQAALDTARKALDVARSNYEKTIIRAPFEGVATELNLEIGEFAQVGSGTLKKAPIRLVDLKPRLIHGDVDEVDLGKLKVGMAARVKIAAARSEPFQAVLQRVVPFVSTAKEQDRTSEVELRIQDHTQALIPVGASATIEIIIDARSGVLAVPSRAILGFADKRYVFRVIGDRLVKTDIKLGIGNYSKTEVLSGLSESDVVVFAPSDLELREGMKVNVEEVPWL
ncbi:efflux RND transporter periplasmic adaptor subunit [Bdellovibrionota bacterium FG-2]